MENLIRALKLTKWRLFEVLTARQEPLLRINDVPVWLESISREDGSGHSFNLTVNYCQDKYQVYCRTVD